jgi:hypothetical protein
MKSLKTSILEKFELNKNTTYNHKGYMMFDEWLNFLHIKYNFSGEKFESFKKTTLLRHGKSLKTKCFARWNFKENIYHLPDHTYKFINNDIIELPDELLKRTKKSEYNFDLENEQYKLKLCHLISNDALFTIYVLLDSKLTVLDAYILLYKDEVERYVL